MPALPSLHHSRGSTWMHQALLLLLLTIPATLQQQQATCDLTKPRLVQGEGTVVGGVQPTQRVSCVTGGAGAQAAVQVAAGSSLTIQYADITGAAYTPDKATLEASLLLPGIVELQPGAQLALKQVNVNTSCEHVRALQQQACQLSDAQLNQLQVLPNNVHVVRWSAPELDATDVWFSCGPVQMPANINTSAQAISLSSSPSFTAADPLALQARRSMSCTVARVATMTAVEQQTMALQLLSNRVMLVVTANISLQNNAAAANMQVYSNTSLTVMADHAWRYPTYVDWGYNNGMITWSLPQNSVMTFSSLTFTSLPLGPYEKYPWSLYGWGMWMVYMDRCLDERLTRPQLFVHNCTLVVAPETMEYMSHWTEEVYSPFPDKKAAAEWYTEDTTCTPAITKTFLLDQVKLTSQQLWRAMNASSYGVGFMNTTFTANIPAGLPQPPAGPLQVTKLFSDPFTPFTSIAWVETAQQLVQELVNGTAPNIVLLKNISVSQGMWPAANLTSNRAITVSGWPSQATFLDLQRVPDVMTLKSQLTFRNLILMNGAQDPTQSAWNSNLTLFSWSFMYERTVALLQMQNVMVLLPQSEYHVLKMAVVLQNSNDNSTPSVDNTTDTSTFDPNFNTPSGFGSLGANWANVDLQPGNHMHVDVLVEHGLVGYNITLVSQSPGLQTPFFASNITVSVKDANSTSATASDSPGSGIPWQTVVAIVVPISTVLLLVGAALLAWRYRAVSGRASQGGDSSQLPKLMKGSGEKASGGTSVTPSQSNWKFGVGNASNIPHAPKPQATSAITVQDHRLGPNGYPDIEVGRVEAGTNSFLCVNPRDASITMPSLAHVFALGSQEAPAKNAPLMPPFTMHMHGQPMPVAGGTSTWSMNGRSTLSAPSTSAVLPVIASLLDGPASSPLPNGSAQVLEASPPGKSGSSFVTRVSPQVQGRVQGQSSNGKGSPRVSHVGSMQGLAAAGLAWKPNGSLLGPHAQLQQQSLNDDCLDSFDLVPEHHEQLLINRMELSKELQLSITAPDVASQLQDMVCNMQSELGDQEVEVTRVLGQGGGGVVYQGSWRGLTVAVKTLVFTVVPMQPMSRRQHRAMTEAAICKTLQHPNIVATYAYDLHELAPTSLPSMAAGGGGAASGTHDHGSGSHGPTTSSGSAEATNRGTGQCGATEFKLYIIQEFCDGGSLKVAIEDGKLHDMSSGTPRPAMSHILQLATDIAAGMSHVHSRSVVHGDLTPANVLLKSSPSTDSGYVAKVADFGLAWKLAHGQAHVSNARQGTSWYIAPEVLHVGIMSKAADIYSFGVMLFEMYHGQPYWRSQPDMAGSSLIHRPSPEALIWDPKCPKDYKELLCLCLSNDPQARPTFFNVVEQLLQMQRQQWQAEEQAAAHTSKQLAASPLSSTHLFPRLSGNGTTQAGVEGYSQPRVGPRQPTSGLLYEGDVKAMYCSMRMSGSGGAGEHWTPQELEELENEEEDNKSENGSQAGKNPQAAGNRQGAAKRKQQHHGVKASRTIRSRSQPDLGSR